MPGDQKENLQQNPPSEKTSHLGKRLINQLFILFKTAQIHDIGNVALNQPVQNVLEILKELRSEAGGDVSIQVQDDCIFVHETKLKMDIEGFVSFIAIVEEFKKRQLGEVLFKVTVGGNDLRKFISALINLDVKQSSPFDVLKDQLKQQGMTSIEIEPMEAEKQVVAEVTVDTKQKAQNVYLRTVGIVSEVMESVKLRQSVSLRKSKRLVQNLVDSLLQDETTLLGLTTIRSHDEYTYSHCVNVGILSMAVGQRLGYDRIRLCELGLAAIFHDIGKSDIPLEILNKPTEFTEDEWKVMRRHPILGVKHLVKLKGLDDMTMKIIIGGFEHHLNYDLSGYPKLTTKRSLTLFGRIISLVDCYDALTSSRVYNRVPFPPDKALKFMLSKSGKAFDPLLIKIFVNCLGVYPLGSLVVLDSGEMGVVIQTNPNPDKADRPKVKLVTDSNGNEMDGQVLDLAAVNQASPAYTHTIARTVDAYKYGIDVGRYFL
jgi:HD-GYP domain-containing protein (c-di-GMP phosphodiesterase class II)